MIYINNEKKVNKIKLQKDNFYVVADFDKTLTEGTSISTWGVLANSNIVDEEYARKRTELYNKYRPIEIDMSLSEDIRCEAMFEWWKAHIGLFFEYELKEDVVKKSIKESGLKYRAGAKEFLKKMKELDVPVIIISAGIGNVIEEFLKNEKDYSKNIKIVSNFIIFENGLIKEITGGTIHALNKNIVKLDDESKEILKNRENILLLGDGIGDLKMVSKENIKNTISVGFLDEKIKENLDFYNENFDIVLADEGTFEDVNKILKIY